MRYPQEGEIVRAFGSWRGKTYDIVGTVVREGRRVRSGAVLGQIRVTRGSIGGRELPEGYIAWVPWSAQYIQFEFLSHPLLHGLEMPAPAEPAAQEAHAPAEAPAEAVAVA
jgi:hypothetical protein